MKSKTIPFLMITMLCIFNSYAQKSGEKRIKSSVKEATVFFEGAKVTHNATATLQKGENIVIVESLSPIIDRNSLTIKISHGIMVSSYEFSVDYLSSSLSATAITQKLQDSIDLYKGKLSLVKTQIKVNTESLNFLKKGIEKNIAGSQTGVSIDELVKNMDYYQTKAIALETLIAADYKKQQQDQTTLDRLQNQLEQESIKNTKSSGLLTLVLVSPAEVTANLTIDYFTSAAGWIPFYDIQVLSTEKPIQMTGKAKVFQVTGLDWNKVKLILSAASPSESKTAPLFKTWFLDYWHPIYPMNSMAKSNTYVTSVRGNRIDEQQVMIDGVKGRSEFAELKQTYDESSTITPHNLKMPEPLYFVDKTEVSKEYALSLDPNSIKSKESMPSNKAIAIYGQKAADGIIFITTKSMDDYIVQSDNALNSVYNIDLPYTIPGNGKEQVMELQSKETSATYQYYCVPKLDVNTYLIAQIKNWQKLALHSGNANITYDGTYLGETFINAGSTDSTLTLTLGTDPRISVKREKLKDYSSIKILGNEIKVVLCYQITVKNNQNSPVELVLKDQYPVSKKKEITVELLGETTHPSINDTETGVITWKTALNAGETKTFKISYSVKYPKDRQINIE